MGRLVTGASWCHDGEARKTTGFGGKITCSFLEILILMC